MARIAIVGGGASGLAAAIAAAQAGASVEVFERENRVGKKILATGNGRCNLSNADIMSSDYNDPPFVQAAMNMLPPEDVQLFFSDLGLLAFEEEEGRIYPYSNKASTVLDVLRLGAREAGVVERCEREVACVRPAGVPGGWTLEFCDGVGESFDAVVVCVGGNPPRDFVPADVELHPSRPVLAGLATDTDNIKGLSGIRVRARLYLDADPTELREAWLDVVDPDFEASYSGPEERGEVLFRDWGISGIAAFDMSRHVERGQMVFLDLLPDMEPQDKVDFIYGQAMAHPDRTAAEVMSGMLPSRVARAVVKASGIDPDEPIIAEEEAVVLAMVSESFGLTVRGIADPAQAQVMRGGYATSGFDPRTMECMAHPGLFVAGEALDVDGRCGGYNLHWAWTSGMLAGVAASRAPELTSPGTFEVEVRPSARAASSHAARDSRDSHASKGSGAPQGAKKPSSKGRGGASGGRGKGSAKGSGSAHHGGGQRSGGNGGQRPSNAGQRSGGNGGQRPNNGGQRPKLDLSGK